MQRVWAAPEPGAMVYATYGTQCDRERARVGSVRHQDPKVEWMQCIGWGVDSLSKRRVHREAATMVGWWWWWLRFRDEGGGGSTPEEGRQTASSGADGEPSGPGPGDSPGPSGCAIVVELPSPQSPMSPLPFAIEIVEVNCKISFKQGQGQI
jgi:hypothetical protein